MPDLILLDLYLPDVFGLDLLNRMRVAGVEGDMIVISAANESETVERALKLGVASYLLKPFTLDDLARGSPSTAAAAAAVPRTSSATRPTSTACSGARTPRPALPKGMSPETAELILATLRAGREQSAQECADAAGISRVSARRYLEYFVAQGRPRCRSATAPGRPERRYQLAPSNQSPTPQPPTRR